MEIDFANSLLLSKMMKIENREGMLNKKTILTKYRPSTPLYNSYK
jgi:hypothetical protein